MRARTFEIWLWNTETRDFQVETVKLPSLKAAREYGKERERDTDYLKFRDAEVVDAGN